MDLLEPVLHIEKSLSQRRTHSTSISIILTGGVSQLHSYLSLRLLRVSAVPCGVIRKLTSDEFTNANNSRRRKV